ncbi:MAG: amidohydrolase [Gemmatimonadota bacterium]
MNDFALDRSLSSRWPAPRFFLSKFARPLLLVGLLGLAACAADAADDAAADVILTGGEVWTGEDSAPWAEAIALRGNEIVAVGSVAEVDEHRGRGTEVVELEGRFVAPGFIDNHTHFNSAGALLLGVNLLDVADEEGLVAAVRAAAVRLPAGAWMIGGDWGAYEAWAAGSTGQSGGAGAEPFRPDRATIDPVTPDHPALLSRWDRSAYLANARALEAAAAECGWSGVECTDGEPTGRLTPEAAARVREAIPPKSLEQKLDEARIAMAQLAELGVTTIHDNTPPDQFEVYRALIERDEMTTRIYARPSLTDFDELPSLGLPPEVGGEWVKVHGLKGHVDGIMGNSSARFYEPYLHTGERGSWRAIMSPAGNMERILLKADSAGFVPQVHAIGDQAVDTLLDMFERVMALNGEKERRFRMIHAQVLRDGAVADRMAALGIIAEVQPYHAIDDMRWMEERIGERSRWAYAFRTLDEAGVLLSFGSDWPGTNAAWYTANPLMGMYAAVTRQTLDGEPAGGWFPEERVDTETALRAYTVNNAWAAGEENLKGSLAPGKLADLVVLDRNPLEVPGNELKDIRVVRTIVDGRTVFVAP